MFRGNTVAPGAHEGMSKLSVGFLGLGQMGRRMAARLLAAGHTVRAYNRSPNAGDSLRAKGATICLTPAEAASGADVVLSIVTDDAAARSVWLAPDTGALSTIRPGAIVIESSTVTPGWVSNLAQAVEGRGAYFLDAPVAGSTPQAEAGQLAFLVGGEAERVDAVRDLLMTMGKAVLHVGPAGHGAVFKLLVNALFATQVATMAELLRAAQVQGLEPSRVVDLLSKMPVSSPAAVGVASLMVANDHAPRFPVDLVAKDLGYAAELADEMPMSVAARERYTAASDAGDGAANLSAVGRLEARA